MGPIKRELEKTERLFLLRLISLELGPAVEIRGPGICLIELSQAQIPVYRGSDAREPSHLQPGEGDGEEPGEGLKKTASPGCGRASPERREVWGINSGTSGGGKQRDPPTTRTPFVKVWGGGQRCQLPALVYPQSPLPRTPIAWGGGPSQADTAQRVEKMSEMWVFSNASASHVTTLSLCILNYNRYNKTLHMSYAESIQSPNTGARRSPYMILLQTHEDKTG